MLQSVRDACTLHEMTLSLELPQQIENLSLLIEHEAQDATAFFNRNYVTKGMQVLLDEGLARLAGQSKQAVFELRQAMGGGKTHSMVALGLLALDPAIRQSHFPDLATAYPFGSAKVVAVNGRDISRNHFMWGDIAAQLGKAEDFSQFWRNGADAPGEKDWKNLIGSEPTLILLDELPPYFDYAVSRPVGGGNLAQVSTYALSNLLSAASKLKACCIVISDLSATYESASQQIRRAIDHFENDANRQPSTELNDPNQNEANRQRGRRAIDNFQNETNRQARKLTPVELGSNEIYSILKKRLFTKLPPDDVVSAVAAEYARVLGEATKAKAIAKSAEQIADEIHGSYPFHPSVKEVVALFRENEKFRQTRGLMQFVSKLIKSVWERPTNDVYLIGCQHLDFKLRDVREEVKRISDLQEAISHDVCNEETTTAVAQVVDGHVGSDSASQIAAMILTASLSESVEGVKGLTFSQVTEYLIAPNRPASDFVNAFESFKGQTWFMHRKENEAWYFSKQENLNRRLENRAQHAPANVVEKYMRVELEKIFKPDRKLAYEKVMALPLIDEIQLSGPRTCLVLSPDTKFPPAAAEKFFGSITEKNNLLIVSGDGSDLASLEERARRVWAVERVWAETGAQQSAHRAELEEEREKAAQSFNSCVINMFNRILYPYYDRQKKAAVLRPAKLAMQFLGNKFNAEEQIEKALKDTSVSKLYDDVSGHFDMLRQRAERDLWPQNQQRARWSDIQTEARSQAVWYWLPPSGLNQLRELAIGQGKWRDSGDGYLEKGPFPEPETSVVVAERDYKEETATATLEVTARDAGPNGRVHFSAKNDVSAQSPVWNDTIQTTDATHLYFLAIDPDGRHKTGEVKKWSNKLQITHDVQKLPDRVRVTLSVVPRGQMRWNDTGITPREGAIYSGPIEFRHTQPFKIYAYAEDEGLSATRTFNIAGLADNAVDIDRTKPVRVRKSFHKPSTTESFHIINAARTEAASLREVSIEIGEQGKTFMARFGSDTLTTAEIIEKVIAIARESLRDPQAEVKIRFKGMEFPTGDAFLQFSKTTGLNIDSKEVEQS